jgi:hypothetical protein
MCYAEVNSVASGSHKSSDAIKDFNLLALYEKLCKIHIYSTLKHNYVYFCRQLNRQDE